MKRDFHAGAITAAPAVSAVAAVATRDLLQREHALLRNFPLVGHARYLLESIGPELRQYLVAGNNEERPFTRDQRRWVYASAKKENNYFGFGTDNDIEYTPGYPVINHRTFGRAIPPSSPASGHEVELPCAKVVGATRGRPAAFRPGAVANISAMRFGSLSGTAIEALNRGAALAGLRRDLVKVAEACGVEHPALIDPASVEILDGRTGATPLHEVYGYQPSWGMPSQADRAEIIRLMTATEPQGGAAPRAPSAVG